MRPKGLTARQRERLQAMFDDNDEFMAWYREQEAAKG